MKRTISKRHFHIALPLLFLLAGLLLFETRDYQAALTNPVGLANIHKILGICSAIFYSAFFLLKAGGASKLDLLNKCFAIFILVGFLSYFLADNRSLIPIWKLTELLAVFFCSLFMIMVVKQGRAKPEFFYDLTISFVKFLIVAALLGAIFFPSQALRPVLTESSLLVYGPTLIPVQLQGTILKLNPNSVGAYSAILLFISLHRRENGNRQFSNLVWILLSMLLLVVSQSRTAIIAFVFAYALVSFTSKKRSLVKSLFLSAVALTVVFFASSLLWEFMSRGMSVDRVASMSGRMYWWEVAFSEFQKAPIVQQVFGLGYYSAGRSILALKLDSAASTLHSDYVDILISTGWLGLTLLLTTVLYFLFMAFSCSQKSPHPIFPEILGVGTIMAVRSLTGQTFLSYGLYTVLFVCASVIIVCRYSLTGRHRQSPQKKLKEMHLVP